MNVRQGHVGWRRVWADKMLQAIAGVWVGVEACLGELGSSQLSAGILGELPLLEELIRVCVALARALRSC